MRRTRQYLAATVIALCLSVGTALQAGAREGPARSDGLGDVHFSVSCTDAAQVKFHRAMDWRDSMTEPGS